MSAPVETVDTCVYRDCLTPGTSQQQGQATTNRPHCEDESVAVDMDGSSINHSLSKMCNARSSKVVTPVLPDAPEKSADKPANSNTKMHAGPTGARPESNVVPHDDKERAPAGLQLYYGGIGRFSQIRAQMPETMQAMNTLALGDYNSPWDRNSAAMLVNPANVPFASAQPVGMGPDLDINEVSMLATQGLWGAPAVAPWWTTCALLPTAEQRRDCALASQSWQFSSGYDSLLSAYDLQENLKIYRERNAPEVLKSQETFVTSFPRAGLTRSRGAQIDAAASDTRETGNAVAAGSSVSNMASFVLATQGRGTGTLFNALPQSPRRLPAFLRYLNERTVPSSGRPPSSIRRLRCHATAEDMNANCILDRHELFGDPGIDLFAYYSFSPSSSGGARKVFPNDQSQPLRVLGPFGNSATNALRTPGGTRDEHTANTYYTSHPVADAAEQQAVRDNAHLRGCGLRFDNNVDEWVLDKGSGRQRPQHVNLIARAEGVPENDALPYVPKSSAMKAYQQDDEERCVPSSFATGVSILNATFDKSLADSCNCPETRYSARFPYLLQRIAECPYRCNCGKQAGGPQTQSRNGFASTAMKPSAYATAYAGDVSRVRECGMACDPKCGALLSVVAKVFIEDGTVPEAVWDHTDAGSKAERGGPQRAAAIESALSTSYNTGQLMFLGGWARIDAFQPPADVLSCICSAVAAGYPVLLNMRVFPNQARMLQTRLQPATCNEPPKALRCAAFGVAQSQVSRTPLQHHQGQAQQRAVLPPSRNNDALHTLRVAAGTLLASAAEPFASFVHKSADAHGYESQKLNAWDDPKLAHIAFDCPTVHRVTANVRPGIGSNSDHRRPGAVDDQVRDLDTQRRQCRFIPCGSNPEFIHPAGRAAHGNSSLDTQDHKMRRISVAGGLSSSCAHNVYHEAFSLPGPQGPSAYMGHCVTVVGYSDRYGALHVRNSFGEHWGASGDFNIPYTLFGVDPCSRNNNNNNSHSFKQVADAERLVHGIVILLPRSHT